MTTTARLDIFDGHLILQSALPQLQTSLELLEKPQKQVGDRSNLIRRISTLYTSLVNAIPKETPRGFVSKETYLHLCDAVQYLSPINLGSKDADILFVLRNTIIAVSRYCFQSQYASLGKALASKDLETASALVKAHTLNPLFATILQTRNLPHGPMHYQIPVLQLAIREGDRDIIKWMISQKVDFNFFSIPLNPPGPPPGPFQGASHDYNFYPPLSGLLATWSTRKIEILKDILSAGANPLLQLPTGCALTDLPEQYMGLHDLENAHEITFLMLASVKQADIGLHTCRAGKKLNIISCMSQQLQVQLGSLELGVKSGTKQSRENNEKAILQIRLFRRVQYVAVMHGVIPDLSFLADNVKAKEAEKDPIIKCEHSIEIIKKMSDSTREKLFTNRLRATVNLSQALQPILPADLINTINDYMLASDRAIRILAARKCFLIVFGSPCWETAKKD